jgi:hypothetical protein
MTRLQRILSGLVILQLGLAAIVFWPRAADGGSGGPLLGELDADAVTAITLTNRSGVRSEMQRRGGEWVLSSAADYPVDAAKVSPLLEKLAAITTDRLVTRTADSHRRLQVAGDDFVVEIGLTMTGGAAHTIYIGSAPNATATHVRLGGQDETYLTGAIASWEVNPAASSWIDTGYVSLDQTGVTALVLENGNGRFEFVKDEEGTWQLLELEEGETLDASKVTALLGRVSNLRLTEPLGTREEAAYRLSEPQATLTITMTDDEGQSSQVGTLVVGAQDAEDNSFIVKWSGSEYYVRVSAFSVESLVETTRDDLLVPPPEPSEEEPEEEAAPERGGARRTSPEELATPTPEP